METPFIIVCGMHRSGTSLVAQALADNGIHMGSDLVSADESNPAGHFEDRAVVNLHNRIIKREHDSVYLLTPTELSISAQDIREVQEIVKVRKSLPGLPGMERPTRLLFHRAMGACHRQRAAALCDRNTPGQGCRAVVVAT